METNWLRVHLLASLTLILPAAALAKDTVPQWVRDAAAEELPVYPPETNAVALLEEYTITVEGPGKTTEHCRLVIRILRPQGRNYGDLHTYFDSDSKISSMKIWSIGADGREYQLRDDQISTHGFGGGNLYSDYQERVGSAPANDMGAVVAMEYEQKVRPYMSEDVWRYQSAIPVHKAIYTLQLAPGFEYRTTWFHHAPIQPADLGGNRWQWVMTDIPAVDVRHVAMHPSPESLYERMSVHYFGPGMVTPFRGNWVSIGEWYSQLIEGRMQPSPEVTAKAKELTAGLTGFYSKTAAISNFLQRDIRYFAIEVGIGGFQPHYAADVYKNHYGDCKDKATLLVSMLSAVGIEGRLVMVDAERGVIDPNTPSDFGNHMIAAIKVPAGEDTSKLPGTVQLSDGDRFVIFDPTQPWLAFGQIPDYEQGSYGLLIDGKDSQIVALPVQQPETAVIARTGKFTLKADGTLSGEMKEVRSGNAAWIRRARLSSQDAKERGLWLDQLVRGDLSNFSVDDLKVEHLEEINQPLEVSYRVTVPQYSRVAGNMLLLRPRVLGRDGPEVDREPNRILPVDLENVLVQRDDYEIELPPGYTVDELPPAVKLDMDFATYESATTLKANTLHFNRTLTVHELTLPAAKYKDLVSLSAAIKADEQGRAVLKQGQ